MGVTSFLLLSCLGLAITSQAQHCTKPVGGPNMSLRDADILLEQFPDGSQVSFVCDVGYTSAGGSRTITCTAGSWTRLSLRCERKNCGAFEEVENGNIEYPDGGTEFGDKIVITCLPGFRLVGRGEILCEDAGWNGRKPRCEVVTCDPPAQVQHGSFSPEAESYSYRDVVQYSCDRDFTLNGSRSASCSDDATFQPAPPKCIRVQCEEPEIKDASWVSGSRPPYGYQATVTHKCNLGFKMIGQPTIVCNINSKWSPKPPTCEKVTCAQLSNVEHGSFGPVKESYNYKDVVQYSCEKGFTLSGSKSISCSDDGTFKPAPPTCIRTPTTPKTTTTTTTTTTTKSKEGTGGDGEKDDGNKNVGLGLGIFGGIVICVMVALVLVCHHFGWGPFEKKKGTDRTPPDTEAPKVEENLPLSSQQQS